MQVNSYKIRSKFFTETHRQHPRINIQAIDFLLSKQPITVAEVDIGIDPEFLHIGIKQPAVLQIDIDTGLQCKAKAIAIYIDVTANRVAQDSCP
jgi:hypothetical protein